MQHGLYGGELIRGALVGGRALREPPPDAMPQPVWVQTALVADVALRCEPEEDVLHPFVRASAQHGAASEAANTGGDGQAAPRTGPADGGGFVKDGSGGDQRPHDGGR